MDRERSRSLSDVSRMKEVVKRGLVEILTPRDLSEALGPLGHKWLPPERPSQGGPSTVDFNPRFTQKKTTKKSRIPTPRGPSVTSARRPSKSRPSTKAVSKQKQSYDSSSELDSDEGSSTKIRKPSMQTSRRPRSAPTSGDKSSLIPPPIITKALTPKKPVSKQETSLKTPRLSRKGAAREAPVAGTDSDEKSDEEQNTSFTGDEQNTSPIGDEQDTFPTGDGNQRNSPAGDDEQSTSLTGDGGSGDIEQVSSLTSCDEQSISPERPRSSLGGVIDQRSDDHAPMSGDVLPSYLLASSPKSDLGGDMKVDMTVPGSPSRGSSTSQSLTGSPFSSDSELTSSSESLITSPTPLSQYPITEGGLPEVASQNKNGDNLKDLENPTEKGRSLGERQLSKSHDIISLGSIQRNKIMDLRSCKSFLMLPHITTPSQPELSSSFRQLLHGCHSYCQMPHITDTESDFDFPTVSVMALVKADEAATSDKERLHPAGSETSSDEENSSGESERPPSEQVLDFWDRHTRPRSFTAPADLYSTDGQSRSYEVFPRHLSSRIKFDQSLERVAEVPEGDEGGLGQARDSSTEHTQGQDHAHDGRRVLVLSKHYDNADDQTARDQQSIRRECQEEVLCRWRKREGIPRKPRMRSYTYSSGDYIDKDVDWGLTINENGGPIFDKESTHSNHSGRPTRDADKLQDAVRTRQYETFVRDLESRLSRKEKEVKKIKTKSSYDCELSRKRSKEMKNYLAGLQDELEGAQEYIRKLEERSRRQSQDIEEMRGAMIEGVTSLYNGEIRELWDGVEERQANSYSYIAELETKLKQNDAELEKEKRAVKPGTATAMTTPEASEGADDIVHGMETVLMRKNHEIELLQESLRQKDTELKELARTVEKMSEELKTNKESQDQLVKGKLELKNKELKLKDKQIKELENALKQNVEERYSEANELIESAKISLKNAHDLNEALKASAKQRDEEVTDVEQAIKSFVYQKERETRELNTKHARVMKVLEEELEQVREENFVLLRKNETEKLRCFAEMESRAEMETQIKNLQQKLREAQKCVRSEVKGRYREAEELWEACGTLKANVGDFHAGIENELEARRTELQNLLKVKDELEQASKDRLQDSKTLQLMETQIAELQKENVEIMREKHEEFKAMEAQTTIVLAMKDEAISQLKQANSELVRQQENYIECLKLKFNDELQKKEKEFANMQMSASELLKKKEEQIDNLKAELKQVFWPKETAVKDPHDSCKETLNEKDREIQRLKNCHTELLRQMETITEQLKTEMLETLRGKDTEIEDLKQFCHEVFQKAANDVVQLGKSLSKELLSKEEELENLKLAYEGTIQRKDEDSKELWKSLRELSVTKESMIQELEESYNGKLAVKDHEIDRLRLQSQAIVETRNCELGDTRKQLIATKEMLGKFQEHLECATKELVTKERKIKEMQSRIEDQRRTEQDSEAKQMALKRLLEDKDREFTKLQKASTHTSETFAKDYRDLQEISSERSKDKDRMITILEAKMQDAVRTKKVDIHRNTAALQEQHAVKDQTIQFLTLSVKEAEDKVRKNAAATERENGNLEQVIKVTREKLQSCSLKLEQETENKNSEIKRLQKVVEDTIKRTALQLEEQREKAEKVARENENEVRSLREKNVGMLSALQGKNETIANLQRSLERTTSDKMEACTTLTDMRQKMEDQNNKTNNRMQALERENLDYKDEIKSLKHLLRKDEQGMKTLELSVNNMRENLRVKDKALQSYSRTLAEETKTREALTDNSRRLSEELIDYRGKLLELKQSVQCFQDEKKATVFRATKSEREITEYRNTADHLKQENASLKLEVGHLKQQSKECKRQETFFKDKIRNQTATVSGLRDRVDRLQMELSESEQVRQILDSELKAKDRQKQLMAKPDHSRLTAELEEVIDQATRRANYNIGTSTDRLLTALQTDETTTKQLRQSLQSQKNEINKLEESVKENKQREDALRESTQVLSGELKYKDDVIVSLERTIENMKEDSQQLVVSSQRKYSSDVAEIADLKQELTTMKKTFEHALLEKETLADSLKSDREILTAHVKYLKDTMKKDEISKKTLEDFAECLEKDKDSLMNQLGTLRDELEDKENELEDVKRFAREAGIRNKMLRETVETYQAAGTSQKRQPI